MTTSAEIRKKLIGTLQFKCLRLGPSHALTAEHWWESEPPSLASASRSVWLLRRP